MGATRKGFSTKVKGLAAKNLHLIGIPEFLLAGLTSNAGLQLHYMQAHEVR
jgi:hypothetical protein